MSQQAEAAFVLILISRKLPERKRERRERWENWIGKAYLHNRKKCGILIRGW